MIDSEGEEESGDEYDEDSESEEDDGVESSSDNSPKGNSSPIMSTLLSVVQAMKRGVAAAFQSIESPKDNGDEDTSLFMRVVQFCQGFWSAVLDQEGTSSSKKAPAETQSTSATEQDTNDNVSTSDFGAYLAQAYGVTDTRNEGSPILGGSFNDALKIARSQARLLVVLIPSSAPRSKKKNDIKAIESFLSSEVATVAEKKARKKGGDTGSFLLWGAKAGSSEATIAMKRLKVNPKNTKGEKIPILLIAYPAQIFSKGQPKVVPKVLAQHHCSPPPSIESITQWMNDLRKRHAKQFIAMQKQLQEIQQYKERKEGYKESIQIEKERKIREKKEEEERLAKEKAEKERLAALEKRREELLAALPEEPGEKVKDVTTLSIRFSDGRAGKRRFTKDTPISDVFNWVDATYLMERETVILTTMNGKQTFSWEDTTDKKTLKDAGLGRMVGFRVSEKQTAKEGAEEGKKEAGKKEA